MKLLRQIPDNSNRRENNFVIVDCAALPETIVESTLFGHVKGAFTGENGQLCPDIRIPVSSHDKGFQRNSNVDRRFIRRQYFHKHPL